MVNSYGNNCPPLAVLRQKPFGMFAQSPDGHKAGRGKRGGERNKVRPIGEDLWQVCTAMECQSQARQQEEGEKAEEIITRKQDTVLEALKDMP